MSRFNTALAAALTLTLGGLTLGAASAQAHDVLDHSNSASATGSPFAGAVAQTRDSLGASPQDDSGSASAVGSPFSVAVPVTPRRGPVQATDWSNSASALGGIPARRAPASPFLG